MVLTGLCHANSNSAVAERLSRLSESHFRGSEHRRTVPDLSIALFKPSTVVNST